jgi:carbamoyl-phosphate synthase large subunit
MNVLITSASRKVGLVRAFKDAMRRLLPEGRVIAVDVNPYAPALYEADAGYLVPRSEVPNFLDYLLEFCLRRSVKLIIPTRDEELLFFAEHSEVFLREGIRVMIGSSDVIRLCLDKESFLKFCSRKAFGFPKPWLPNDWENPAIYPVFLRPRTGKGGRGAKKIASKAELSALTDNPTEVLVQEYINAPEYTIDLFADFSSRTITAVPRKRLYVWGGESFVTVTENNPVVIQETVRLAEEVGLVGHNTIQCFVRDGKPLFIEINPRFGGAVHLSIRAGADSPNYLLRLMLGEKLESRLGQFTDNLAMSRYVEDTFLLPTDLIKVSKL